MGARMMDTGGLDNNTDDTTTLSDLDTPRNSKVEGVNQPFIQCGS